MKAGYHGYLLEPPFEPRPEHECWVPLEPKGQSVNVAIREMIHEVALTAKESKTMKGFGPSPIMLVGVFREALEVAQLDLVDDGSDCLHWFLLRWGPA